MKSFASTARVVMLLLALAVLATGCMPRGGSTNTGWTVVTSAEGAVYGVLATGQVVALNAESAGSEMWLYPPKRAGGGGFSLFGGAKDADAAAPLNAVYGIPALTDEWLLVTSFDRHLHAFERQTGLKVWQYPAETGSKDLGPLVGGVQVYEGVAYFASSDGSVRALNLATQKAAWPQPFATENRVWGRPAVDAQRVYVGSMDHHVYAIARDSGQMAWKVDLGGSVPGDVTLADGKLYVGAVDRRLHVLNAADGAKLWSTPPLGGWVWGEVLVHGGGAFVGTLDGHVHGLDATTGNKLWEPVKVEGAVRAGPAVVDGTLIVGTDAGMAYRIDAQTGAFTAFPKLEGGILSTPAVSGTDVYVATTVGKVYAFDVQRGIAQLWVYPPAKQ
ncbi:MAG: PQQ-binding-like beta-propeller repeat protein [Chloroflexota bacterium]